MHVIYSVRDYILTIEKIPKTEQRVQTLMNRDFSKEERAWSINKKQMMILFIPICNDRHLLKREAEGDSAWNEEKSR